MSCEWLQGPGDFLRQKASPTRPAVSGQRILGGLR